VKRLPPVASMLPTTLAAWLDYQQRIHPRAIELGLDRVRAVWTRMGAPAPAPVVISVGGTNGKGSTVAFLEAMLGAAGKRVGAFTSPHLLRYNERVRVDGRDVDDAALLDAFERIESARAEIPLTYFEYGTLAALWIFSCSSLDVALLEVGLGGRLDAVNIIDADVAIVTTIDLDHQDWLGDNRDSIGREKAGIFRSGRPAIIGDSNVPRGLLDEALRVGADVRIAGRDFRVDAQIDGWCWSAWPAAHDDRETPQTPARVVLPEPALGAACQVDNASAAIAALYALRDRLGWNEHALRTGVAHAHITARMQRFGHDPELIIDVAHNPQAARMLARSLHSRPASARTLAVFSALIDKDARGIVAALAAGIDAWYLAGLDAVSSRGVDAQALRATLAASFPARVPVAAHVDVAEALAAAFADARSGDRIVAFGSFFVAAAALEFAVQRRMDGI
jgi:dihydrofolate synthase/folylpolyglutamate synthase